jgi:hypothetical protein
MNRDKPGYENGRWAGFDRPGSWWTKYVRDYDREYCDLPLAP